MAISQFVVWACSSLLSLAAQKTMRNQHPWWNHQKIGTKKIINKYIPNLADCRGLGIRLNCQWSFTGSLALWGEHAEDNLKQAAVLSETFPFLSWRLWSLRSSSMIYYIFLTIIDCLLLPDPPPGIQARHSLLQSSCRARSHLIGTYTRCLQVQTLFLQLQTSLFKHGIFLTNSHLCIPMPPMPVRSTPSKLIRTTYNKDQQSKSWLHLTKTFS